MLSVLSRLLKFMRVHRRYRLVPILPGVAILASLPIVSQGTAITPFIYTIF